MKTRLLMGFSAAVMGLLGLVCTFLPAELAAYAGAAENLSVTLVVQAAGALYLGFAALNWLARALPIGGIYSRPIALGNFLHFTVTGFALLKAVAAGSLEAVVLPATVVYVLFAAWFGLVLFTHPGKAGPGRN